MNKRRIVLVLVAVLIVAGAVLLVRHRKQQLASIRIAKAGPVPVRMGTVGRDLFIGSRIYFGVVTSNRRADVRARAGGQVSRVLKWEATPVEEAEALVELDGLPGSPSATRASLEISIRNLEQAVSDMDRSVRNLKAVYDRDRMLFENQAVAQQVVELSENRWKEARVQLSTLRNELAGLREKEAFFTIRAPFDGILSSVRVHEGDVVAPGQPLLTVEDASPCKIVVTVASGDLAGLRPGTPAILEYQGRRHESTLSRVYPSAADNGSGTVEILEDRPPFGLPLGASVAVRVETTRLPDALVVPVDAVLTGVERTMVFTVDHDKVRTVPVKVLAESETAAAVTGDLDPGQTVVRGSDSLLMRLSDGMAVARAGEVP